MLRLLPEKTKEEKTMKNPIQQFCREVSIVIWRCTYWRKCPYYVREVCCDAWVMNGCGKYKKYQMEEHKP
jgi:hypothetical protein